MKNIHKPYQKFKGWLRSENLVYKDIADFLGVSIQTVTAKVNGQSDFTLSEIKAMNSNYNLSNDIFFG